MRVLVKLFDEKVRFEHRFESFNIHVLYNFFFIK